MERLQAKTIAALIKQVDLLNKDGALPADMESTVKAISALTALLAVLNNC